MCTLKVSYVPMGLVILCVVVATFGCRSIEPAELEALDSAYLARPLERRQVAFDVVFARYEDFDADLVEECWALLTPPAQETSGLWQANGLRVGWIASEDAPALREILRKMHTLQSTERRFVMPSRQSIEIHLGRTATKGLIYETSAGKAYRDVSDMRFEMLLRSLGAGRDASVSIVPFFTSEGDEVTPLGGLELLVEVSEAEMILVGMAAEREERRIGGLLMSDDPIGRRRSLLIIEPKLTW